MTPFDAIAPFYDVEHDGLTADIAMYVRLLEGACRSVLIAGVGTGRVADPLTKAGHAVFGIDNSRPMLAFARRRLDEPTVARLVEADMTDFDLGRRFDSIIVPLDTFGTLSSSDAQVRALESLRRHLTDRGVLLLDLMNPHILPSPDQAGLVRPRFESVQGGRRIKAFDSVAIDPANQTMDLKITYRISTMGEIRDEEVVVPVRWVYRFELELMARSAGLTVTDIWGDYDQSAYAWDSPRMIVASIPERFAD